MPSCCSGSPPQSFCVQTKGYVPALVGLGREVGDDEVVAGRDVVRRAEAEVADTGKPVPRVWGAGNVRVPERQRVGRSDHERQGQRHGAPGRVVPGAHQDQDRLRSGRRRSRLVGRSDDEDRVGRRVVDHGRVREEALAAPAVHDDGGIGGRRRGGADARRRCRSAARRSGGQRGRELRASDQRRAVVDLEGRRHGRGARVVDADVRPKPRSGAAVADRSQQRHRPGGARRRGPARTSPPSEPATSRRAGS